MIEILFFAGCPNHEPTVELAREVLSELGLDPEIREIPVETAEQAERHRFVGSPSVRVNGKDIEPDARHRTDFGLSCRMYEGGGVPPKELLVQALREAA
jgi:hypothetical protein